MSNLSMFLTFLSEVVTSVLNFTLAIGFVIIVFFVTITELMKAFNPNIETTAQAIKHITTKLNEEYDEEEEKEDDDNPILYKNSPFLMFLLYPIIGTFVIIAFLQPLFPTYMAGVLDIVNKYYVSVLPYFAIVIGLCGIGLASSMLVMWLARRTYELAASTIQIINEKKDKEINENE